MPWRVRARQCAHNYIVRQPLPLTLQREKGGAEHALKMSGTSGKSFLQNEGRCRDGVNYEKGCQQEDASADNKNHTSIPTSFFTSSSTHTTSTVIIIMM